MVCAVRRSSGLESTRWRSVSGPKAMITLLASRLANVEAKSETKDAARTRAGMPGSEALETGLTLSPSLPLRRLSFGSG